MKTTATTIPSMADSIQNHVNEVLRDLQTRKDRGDDYIDSYEYGFLKAVELIDRMYGLDVEGLETIRR